jgi:cytochrome b561
MTTPYRYDRRLMAIHWLSALLIPILWTMEHQLGWFPRWIRPYMHTTHNLLGFLLVLVLVTRVLIRLRIPAPPPSSPNLWAERAARAGHLLLYVLMATTLFLGITNILVRGMNVYGWFIIPRQFIIDRPNIRMINQWHELAANALLLVALGHAAVALVHHYVLRDGLLRRMMPAPRG